MPPHLLLVRFHCIGPTLLNCVHILLRRDVRPNVFAFCRCISPQYTNQRNSQVKRKKKRHTQNLNDEYDTLDLSLLLLFPTLAYGITKKLPLWCLVTVYKLLPPSASKSFYCSLLINCLPSKWLHLYICRNECFHKTPIKLKIKILSDCH